MATDNDVYANGSIGQAPNKINNPSDVLPLHIEGAIDLFEIAINGVTFKVTPFTGNAEVLPWRSADDTFSPYPLEILDVEEKGNGVAPTPTLVISNLSKIFASILFETGDFTGATVTRWRIRDKYRYGQPSYSAANVQNNYMSLHKFIIVQTESLTRTQLVLKLTTSIDKPNQLSPVGSVTSDRFPGVTRLKAY